MQQNDQARQACRTFAHEIAVQEDYLFGLYLFQATAPRLIRWIQARAYRQTVSRVSAAISRAKSLLREVTAGERPWRDLETFRWPPWTHEMEERITSMLRAYNITFPFRPKQALSREELARVKRTALDLF